MLCDTQRRAAVHVGSLALQQNQSSTLLEGQHEAYGMSWYLTATVDPPPSGHSGVWRWLHVAPVVPVFGELAWEAKGGQTLFLAGSTFLNTFSCL